MATLVRDLDVGDEIVVEDVSITLLKKSGQLARLAIVTGGKIVEVRTKTGERTLQPLETHNIQ